MLENRLHLAVIIGSTRQGRFAPTVAKWFVGRAAERGDMIVETIDLADAGVPDILGTPRGSEAAVLSRKLASADAFVVVTPEYNHSFPAPLKSLMDWHSKEWAAKPVGFVSYGGISGGLRAVEQLRQIFAELHAVTVRDTVSFHNAWERFGSDGMPKDPKGCGGAAAIMLDQLAWWASALREAKRLRPYGVRAA